MSARSARTAVLAAGGLLAFYVAVVAGASRSLQHLVARAGDDWYLLAPIVVGFGIQVGLLAELRRLHRMQMLAGTAGGAGAGASAVGMVACCAHHLADLVPFVGLTGIAAFLTDYRVVFMLVGLGVNALGIFVAARRLKRVRVETGPGRHVCAPA